MKPLTVTLEELMHRVERHARRDDDTGCLIWTGALQNGVPYIKVHKQMYSIRRAIFEAQGKPLTRAYQVRPKCDHPMCVEPEHQRPIPLKDHLAQISKEQKKHLPTEIARRAKISTTQRERYGKLTDEDVREIMSSEETGESLAKRFGVSKGLINKMRQGLARREYGASKNPFEQLLGL